MTITERATRERRRLIVAVVRSRRARQASQPTPDHEPIGVAELCEVYADTPLWIDGDLYEPEDHR